MKKFLHSLCHGEKYGIAVLTMEEQRLIFKRLSRDSYKVFRDKQLSLLHAILNSFEIEADTEQLKLHAGLSQKIYHYWFPRLLMGLRSFKWRRLWITLKS